MGSWRGDSSDEARSFVKGLFVQPIRNYVTVSLLYSKK